MTILNYCAIFTWDKLQCQPLRARAHTHTHLCYNIYMDTLTQKQEFGFLSLLFTGHLKTQAKDLYENQYSAISFFISNGIFSPYPPSYPYIIILIFYCCLFLVFFITVLHAI